eukprot:Rmarinus@m.28186
MMKLLLLLMMKLLLLLMMKLLLLLMMKLLLLLMMKLLLLTMLRLLMVRLLRRMTKMSHRRKKLRNSSVAISNHDLWNALYEPGVCFYFSTPQTSCDLCHW